MSIKKPTLADAELAQVARQFVTEPADKNLLPDEFIQWVTLGNGMALIIEMSRLLDREK